jgi:hypothetical protein
MSAHYSRVITQLNDIYSMYQECLDDEININGREDEFDFYYWATSDWLLDAIAETHPYRQYKYDTVVGELDSIIHKADLYVSENVEDSEWDGERVGNGEWEYAFWDCLE